MKRNPTENVAILGSTGSIGRNAIDVIKRLQPRFRVSALASGRNVKSLAEQAETFHPRIVSLAGKTEAEEFRRLYKGPSLKVTYGEEGSEEVARWKENDIVVAAITGISGLRPALAAVREGKRLALANKESMVVAGSLLQEESRRSGAQILPVDSEHSGVFQCLNGESKENVRRVILTASGGPFFRTPLEDLESRSVDEVLSHPRWKMGKKVTTDSATLMNKGLELLEARWLFDLEPSRLDILIHPQSIVHSLVEMIDGSVLAQLSQTDMRIPIQFALTYPDRADSPLPFLDLARVRTLEFFPVEDKRYPLLKLARGALESEPSYAVALNAANEAAVSAFLDKRIPFTGIADVVEEVMGGHRPHPVGGLDDIFSIDGETRRQTRDNLKSRQRC